MENFVGNVSLRSKAPNVQPEDPMDNKLKYFDVVVRVSPLKLGWGFQSLARQLLTSPDPLVTRSVSSWSQNPPDAGNENSTFRFSFSSQSNQRCLICRALP